MQGLLGRWIDDGVTMLCSQVFSSSPSPAEKSQSLFPNNFNILPKPTLTILYLHLPVTSSQSPFSPSSPVETLPILQHPLVLEGSEPESQAYILITASPGLAMDPSQASGSASVKWG